MEQQNPQPLQTDAIAPRRSRATLIGLATLIACVLVLWTASGGKLWPPTPHSTYYHLQAEAFRAGQAHLKVTPPPELLALPDPYDPAANANYRIHDALLYDGKYYFYWGPVPALLILPFDAMVPGGLGDHHIATVFALGLTIFFALILSHIRRAFFPTVRPWTIAAMVIAFAACGPMQTTLSRLAVYEVSILGGQMFLFAGVYFALRAMTSIDSAAGARQPLRSRNMNLAIAGAMLALAVGCRVSHAPATIVIALLVLWALWKRHGRGQLKNIAAGLAALGVPLIIGAVALAAFNYARFGNPLEFGQRYQLAGIHVPQVYAKGYLVSPRHVLPNLYIYFLTPLQRIGHWPFVALRKAIPSTPYANDIKNYLTEPIAGALLVVPLILLPLLWIASAVVRRVRGDAPLPVQPWNGAWRWTVLVCLAPLVSAVPVITFFGATARYAIDFMPALLVLATLGLWRIIQFARSGTRDILLTFVALATVYTASIGLAIGYIGHTNNVARGNPRLHEWIMGMTYPADQPPLLLGVQAQYQLQSPDQPTHFVGDGGMTFTICSGRSQPAELRFSVDPNDPDRRFQAEVGTAPDQPGQQLMLTGGPNTIPIELTDGVNHVVLRPLEPPTVRIDVGGEEHLIHFAIRSIQLTTSMRAPPGPVR